MDVDDPAEEFLRTHHGDSSAEQQHSHPAASTNADKMASESPTVDDSSMTPQPAANGQAAAPTNGAKRSAEPSSGTHTRSKRNRYISIAWYGQFSSCCLIIVCGPMESALGPIPSPLLCFIFLARRLIHHQQRVQATQDQVQWTSALPAMWSPQTRMYATGRHDMLSFVIVAEFHLS